MVDGFKQLSDTLCYSEETLTIYYFGSDGINAYLLAPYIRNGHFCEYRNGEIVEAIPTVRVINY